MKSFYLMEVAIATDKQLNIIIKTKSEEKI